MNLFDVGPLELQEYIHAYKVLPHLKMEKKLAIVSLYEDCLPVTYINAELGVIRSLSVDVADSGPSYYFKKRGTESHD